MNILSTIAKTITKMIIKEEIVLSMVYTLTAKIYNRLLKGRWIVYLSRIYKM